MIIGAGAAEQELIKEEIKTRASLRKKIILLVDDDESKVVENEWCSYRWYSFLKDIGHLPRVFEDQPDSPCVPSASGEEEKGIQVYAKSRRAAEMMIVRNISDYSRGC